MHGFAFRGVANNAALGELTPIPDETVYISGNDLMVPAGHTGIVMAHGIGENLSRVVFDSPRIRLISRHSVAPLDDAANPTSNFPVQKMLSDPVPVDPGEALTCSAQNTGGNASAKIGVAWLSDGPIQPVSGADMRTVRGTTDFDAAANVWTNGQITLETDLPAGRYSVLGFRAVATDLLLARLIFPQQGFRPMVIGSNSVSEITDPIFRRGMLGHLGEFLNFVPPKLEVFVGSAQSDPEVYLDVVRLGA